ncbi:reverse transcriptase domain-containing protein [Shinella sp.]|uniref:RNA-directed DNA polymerase n=1 Tax=Shinella sp. TaxID=1870904 RepID=UPI003F7150A0
MHQFNQSPKYPLRWHDIRYVLSASKLKEKWKKKIRYDVRESFFPDLIEFLDIHTDIEKNAQSLRQDIEVGSYVPTSAARYRVEKSRGLCRLMVTPHPLDLLILQTLSDTLYSQIKKASPSKNAFFEPKDHSFSQVTGEEPEYGTFSSWKKFQKKILGFKDESNFIVVTDIANYYDFIDFNNLRNVISAKKQVNESLMDFLIFILRNLSWQPDFMPFRPTGLPQINADAPRLLAHAYLFELDAFIERANKKQYARFMDDIDAGVNSISEAKKLLRDIDLVLQSRNLRLNSGKTKILSASESYQHFRVRENTIIDKFDKIAAAKITSGASSVIFAGKLAKITEKMVEKNRFDAGNGEKVYKRLVNLTTKYNGRLTEKVFRDCVRNRPNLREAAFSNAAKTGYGEPQFRAIFEYYDNGLVCDDAFQMMFSKSLVYGILIYDGNEVDRLNRAKNIMETDGSSGIHSLIWFLSRYAKPDTFLSSVRKICFGRPLHPFTSRLIGGYLGRIIDNGQLVHQLRLIVSSLKDRGAETAFDYIYDLSVDKNKFKKVYPILSSENKSLPLRYSHSKFIILNAVLHNKNLNDTDKEKLKTSHAAILEEPSYKLGGLI